jgi:hypothetical protein
MEQLCMTLSEKWLIVENQRVRHPRRTTPTPTRRPLVHYRNPKKKPTIKRKGTTVIEDTIKSPDCRKHPTTQNRPIVPLVAPILRVKGDFQKSNNKSSPMGRLL